MIGGPETGTAATYLSIVAGVGVLACLDWLTQRRADLVLFFVLAVIVAPAFFVLLDLFVFKRVGTLFPRYFLVSYTFVLLLLAYRLSGLFRQGGANRNVAIGIACLI